MCKRIAGYGSSIRNPGDASLQVQDVAEGRTLKQMATNFILRNNQIKIICKTLSKRGALYL
jgi:hypothetical protein